MSSLTTPTPTPAHNRLDRMQPLLVLAVIATFYGLIQATTAEIPGYDGLFHIKYASLLAAGHSPWDFPWLQATIYGVTWVDHSFLFHCLLVPFTGLGDLHLAAKVAGATLASGAVFSFYLLIRRLTADVPELFRHAWIWPLLILASSDVLHFRLSMVKVPPLAAAGLALALWLMFTRRDRWLLLLAAVFMGTYNGAVILGPVAGVWAAAVYLSERRIAWQAPVFVGVGLLAGLVINPFFPDSFAFAWDHLVGFALRDTPVLRPAEFAPYPLADTFLHAPVAFIATAVGVAALLGARRKLSARTWCLLLLNGLFLLLYLRSRRFVEYWPLFSVAFAAISVHHLLAAAPVPGSAMRRRLVAVGLVVLSAGLAVYNGRVAAAEIDKHMPHSLFQGAAKWLQDHTPPGTVVYNAEWNHFPHLFFYNHHNHWTMGLNETFTYFLDPGLWAATTTMRWGEPGEISDIARVLKRHFGARYAVAIKEDRGLVKHAAEPRNGLVSVYDDGAAVVYDLQPDPGQIALEAELGSTLLHVPGSEMACEPVFDGWLTHREGPLSGNAALGCKGTGATAKIVWPIEVPQAGRWTVAVRYLLTSPAARAWLGMDRQPLGDVALPAGSKWFRDSGVFATAELSAGAHEVGLLVRFPADGQPHEVVVDRVVLTRGE